MNTDAQHARRIVIGAFAAAGVLSSVRAIKNGNTPRLRILFGVMIGAALLAMLSELSPQLATSLALLVLVSSILTAGQALDAVAGLLGN